MEQKKKNARQTVFGIAILCVAVAIFAGAYFTLGPKTSAGSKTIEVEIIVNSTDSTDSTHSTIRTIAIRTDADYLRQALEQESLIEGDESEFGLFIKTVDGINADGSKQEWWCITRDGGQVMTGVDSTPIVDGEHYEITLITGY